MNTSHKEISKLTLHLVYKHKVLVALTNAIIEFGGASKQGLFRYYFCRSLSQSLSANIFYCHISEFQVRRLI